MRRLIALALLLAAPAHAQVQVQRFDFRAAPPADGATHVPPTHAYDGTWGWEPGDPRSFSVRVPEGNWRVTAVLGSPARASEMTIKAESRRLMLDRLAVPRGRTATVGFVVNVRTPHLTPPPANAPGGTAVRLKPREQGSRTWDDRLTLEVLGDRAALAALTVQPADVPTLYLAGDSTVTDQPAEPAASWGQMLPALFGPGLAVANHAESGETLKSFVTELRLDKLLSRVRPGDWAMIQFGHNDQKAQWPQTHAPAATTYRDWLRTYVAELRRLGARPVIVTSPERRNWTGTRVRPTLSDYAEGARAVAAAEHVPLIDLNAASVAIYEALGPARAPLAFNDDGRDATHHDNYGAWVLANAVAAQVRTAAPELAAYLRPGLAPFDPAHPPPPEQVRIVPSRAISAERPAGN